MVKIGGSDWPRWLLLVAVGGVGFYFIQNGEIPTAYTLSGMNLPLQDMSMGLILIGITLGLVYQAKNL